MPQGIQKPISYAFDRYKLVPVQRSLRNGEARVELTPRVFDLLVLLVERFGEVVTKDELLSKVWADANVEEGNINRTVSTLRKNLGKQEDGSDFIETVPKVGYRFVASVSVEDIVLGRPINEPIERVERTDDVPNRSRQYLLPLGILLAVAVAIFAVWKYFDAKTDVDSDQVENGIKRLTNSVENEQVAGWTTDGNILVTRWKDANSPETYILDVKNSALTKAVEPPDLRQGVWSPDNSRIVYWKYNDANAYLSRSDGSESMALPMPVENVSWAHDGTKFAFQSTFNGSKKLQSVELMTYSLADGKVSELTSNENFDGDAGWSPDGKQIVFTSDRDGNYEIYSMNADGSGPKRLTNNPGHDSFPKFSPDGTQIAFNSNPESEKTDLYIMNSDGGNPVRLTDWKSNELTRNGWSPDGTKMAFNSDLEGNDEIYLMNVEPFRPSLLIKDEKADLQTPAFSSDGQQVVYTAEFEDKTSELCVYDLRSKRAVSILKTSSSLNYPQWSPDGEWIAFHQEVEGKWDVFKVKPDGSQLTNLTNNPSSDSLPTWSGDSSTIYFRSNRNGDTENSELFRMNADGSNQTLLPIKKGKLGWSSISRQGKEILFAADRDGDPERLFDIYVADPTTGTESLLTSRSKNDVQSTFSFDGSKAAFVATSDGNQEIYVVNRDGSRSLRITRNISADLFPSFSPDGKRIVFSSNRDGKFAIYEVAIP